MNAPAAMAFGGGLFEGRSVVRFVFTDEGGISRDEPFAVVAGIFVHGDDQLVRLEEELDRLKRKHIPDAYQRDFVFHAKDIWSGKGKIFKNREEWPLHRRLIMLRDLARVPRKLDIPIVYEAVERATFGPTEEQKRNGAEPTEFELATALHSVAFCACTIRIEQFMRAKWPKEVAQVVAEDNDQVRTMLKGTHEIFREPSKANGGLIPNNVLPLRKIRGSVHFASKAESKPLQLADLCAFVIRGHLAGHPKNPPLYRRIKSKMLMVPEAEELAQDWPATASFLDQRHFWHGPLS